MGALATKKLNLSSGAGGLNNRDPAGKLRADEFSDLVNYFTDEGAYAEKRPGKDLVQYAPIDPQPFVTDPNTPHLWHFDTAAGANVPDDTAAPYTAQDLYEIGGRACPSAPGLFPIGAPLARQIVPAIDGVGADDCYGHFLVTNFADLIHGFDTVFFDIWIKINSTFSGKPLTVDVTGGGDFFTYSNSGSHLMATIPQSGFGGDGNEGESRNGLSIYRDWDATTQSNSSDPYIKFKLRTSGGFVTELTSKFLPMNKWLFIRGSYIQSSGKVRLRVNGALHDEKITTGTVDDSLLGTPGFLYIGGAREAQFVPFFAGLEKGFDGLVEEARIRTNVTDAEESVMPMKRPRGKGHPFSRADGVQQLIVSADDGLYYTIGDGGWTKIGDGFSETAYWDGFQYGDLLYLSNGVDNPKSWDGTTLYSWGENLAALTLIEINTGAVTGLGVGRYRYYVTFTFGEKETGLGAYTEGVISVANNHMNIGAIPVGPPNCTGRKIYRTKLDPDAESTAFLMREIADNVTTHLDAAFVSSGNDPATDVGRDGLPDGTTPTNLNDQALYAEVTGLVANTGIGKPRFLRGNYGRIIACGMVDDPYTAVWSEIDTPDVFLGVSFVTAKADHGPLISVSVYYNETHFSKNGYATLVLRGDQPSNWQAFETLHPTAGAIDHWCNVHRVITGSDTYRLAFMGRDGFYEYAGQDIYRISDKIPKTFKSLSQADGSRLQWITTTQAQYMAALIAAAGGSATMNINAPIYTNDGLREVPGDVKLVDQLNYIGMWGGSSGMILPPNLPTGRVIAIAKGPAEGEFYFSFDGDPNLWKTTDNFQTIVSKSVPGGFAAGDRMVEVVYGASVGKDCYFCFSAGTGAGGAVYVYNATDDLWTQADPGPFFWQADVPWKLSSTFFANFNVPVNPSGNFSNDHRNFFRLGNGGGVQNNFDFTGGTNLYLNHAQSVLFSLTRANGRLNLENQTSISSANLVYGGSQPLPNQFVSLNEKPVYGNGRFPLAIGFYGLHDDATYKYSPFVTNSGRWNTSDETGGFLVDFTRRETEFYLGGSVRPQAVWDAVNDRLFFVGSDAEDANGNRLSKVMALTAPRTVPLLTTLISGQSQFAIASDGLNCWITGQFSDGNGNGTTGFLRKVVQASLAVSYIDAFTTNYVPNRIIWSEQNACLYASGKFYPNSRDAFNYVGFLAKITDTAAFTSLKTFQANGAYPVELAYQDTAPFSVFAGMNNISGTNPEPIDSISTSNVVTAVSATPFDDGTGIWSNLLYVPSSGAAGDYLWSDRLYWSNRTANPSDGYVVQLGVAGIWRVVGVFEGAQNNFGLLSAYDDISSDFLGNVGFEFRHGTDLVDLAAAAYSHIQPNQKMVGFSPAKSFGQWRLTLTWDYSVAQPIDSPLVHFVIVNYFIGASSVPRVVGEHFLGRTLWTVARNTTDDNNFMVVYQKNNEWTTFEGWSIKGMSIFRNALFALEDYQLVTILGGDSDVGNLIVARLRTGYIMNQRNDKLLRTGDLNLYSFINARFPTTNGALKITAYKRNSVIGGAWGVIIPAETQEEPVQQKMRPISGVFDSTAWAREFAIQIETSDEVSGDYMPSVNQKERIQEVLLRLWASGDRYANPTELAVP